jgi:acylphosphatase
VRVRVRGRVQGVGFRQSAAARARSLGVGGWVLNAPDGSVEAAFEGPRDRVESMVDWCTRGPSGAHVAAIDTSEETPCGDSDFRIAFAQPGSG